MSWSTPFTRIPLEINNALQSFLSQARLFISTSFGRMSHARLQGDQDLLPYAAPLQPPARTCMCYKAPCKSKLLLHCSVYSIVSYIDSHRILRLNNRHSTSLHQETDDIHNHKKVTLQASRTLIMLPYRESFSKSVLLKMSFSLFQRSESCGPHVLAAFS
jgi:hypothetical protein